MRCHCDSGLTFKACCQPYLQGEAAPNVEALMRSRYTAYVLEDGPYLLATWHPLSRPKNLDFDVERRPKWLGLTIKCQFEVNAQHGTVEFVARYKINGRAFRMHEISRFERIEGRWFYLDGEVD